MACGNRGERARAEEDADKGDIRASVEEKVSHCGRKFRVTSTRRCCGQAKGIMWCCRRPLIVCDDLSSRTRNEGDDRRGEVQQPPPRTAVNMNKECDVGRRGTLAMLGEP